MAYINWLTDWLIDWLIDQLIDRLIGRRNWSKERLERRRAASNIVHTNCHLFSSFWINATFQVSQISDISDNAMWVINQRLDVIAFPYNNFPGYSTCDAVDIDECAVNDGNCSTHANCINFGGSYGCICRTGYAWDGFTCSPRGKSWMYAHR